MLSLIILRGLPGSGKSTLAVILAEGKWPVHCVDDYFTDKSGEYNFKYNENHLAYKNCEGRTEASMKEKVEKVIVENTFTLEWELEPYFKLAEQYGYRVFVATVENRHGGRNVHGIPQEQIKKMTEKYKVVL